MQGPQSGLPGAAQATIPQNSNAATPSLVARFRSGNFSGCAAKKDTG
jgi:hypothetical protein